MIYKVYTKTATVRFPVIFKCQYCGKNNALFHPFIVSASYSDKDAFTQKTINKRESVADKTIDEKLSTLFDRISEATKNNDFKNAEYYCSCSGCNIVPQWSFFKNKTLDKVCEVALYISVLIAAFVLFTIGEGDYSNAKALFIPLGILAFTYTPRFILYYLKKKKIKAIDAQYKPIIFDNEEEFFKRLDELGVQIKRRETSAKTLSENKQFINGYIIK